MHVPAHEVFETRVLAAKILYCRANLQGLTKKHHIKRQLLAAVKAKGLRYMLT